MVAIVVAIVAPVIAVVVPPAAVPPAVIAPCRAPTIAVAVPATVPIAPTIAVAITPAGPTTIAISVAATVPVPATVAIGIAPTSPPPITVTVPPTVAICPIPTLIAVSAAILRCCAPCCGWGNSRTAPLCAPICPALTTPINATLGSALLCSLHLTLLGALSLSLNAAFLATLGPARGWRHPALASVLASERRFAVDRYPGRSLGPRRRYGCALRTLASAPSLACFAATTSATAGARAIFAAIAAGTITALLLVERSFGFGCLRLFGSSCEEQGSREGCQAAAFQEFGQGHGMFSPCNAAFHLLRLVDTIRDDEAFLGSDD